MREDVTPGGVRSLPTPNTFAGVTCTKGSHDMTSNQRLHHSVELVYDPIVSAWNVYLGSALLGSVTESKGVFRASDMDAAFLSKETAAYALAAKRLGNAF